MPRLFFQESLRANQWQMPTPLDPKGYVAVNAFQAKIRVQFEPFNLLTNQSGQLSSNWFALIDSGQNHTFCVCQNETGFDSNVIEASTHPTRRFRVSDASGEAYDGPRLCGYLLIYSNQPAFGSAPLRLDLCNQHGIGCLPAQRKPQTRGNAAGPEVVVKRPPYPLLGMYALWLAGLNLEITWLTSEQYLPKDNPVVGKLSLYLQDDEPARAALAPDYQI